MRRDGAALPERRPSAPSDGRARRATAILRARAPWLILSFMRPGLHLVTPLSLALVACSGGTTGTTASTGATSSSASASATTDDATSTTAATTTTTAATTTASTTAASTTGTTGLELCHFGTTGNSTGSDQPWIELYNRGEALEAGGALQLECGFQGSFMFEVVPYFGGFTPTDEYVYFDLWLDVDGHNDNPDGHFYSNETAPIFVGCMEDTYYDGGFAGTFQVLLFDRISDFAALDGLPAHLHLEFSGDGQPVVVDLDLVVSAAPTEDWQFCGYVGDTDTDTDTGGSTSGTTGP